MISIAGKPLLGHVIDRLRASKYIGETIVATTTAALDAVIEYFAKDYGVKVFRGHADDVLDRFYQAAKEFGINIVVRIGADDPFKDACEVDRVIARLLKAHNDVDYVSNWLKPSYPEGMDVEAFRFESLERAWREAKLQSEREHVTPYIWMHPEIFRLANVEYSQDLSQLRWTLDTPEDLEFTRQVYAELYHGTPFSMQEILKLLSRRPELQAVNGGSLRHSGFWKAWTADHDRARTEELS
jgi:spore coat polysaccharide biosynthesis protein SpsF